MHACPPRSTNMDIQQATVFLFLLSFFAFSHTNSALPAGLDSLLLHPDGGIDTNSPAGDDDDDQPQKYIIRVRKEAAAGSVLSTFRDHYNLYSSLLSSALGATLAPATTAVAEPKLVHSYSSVMTGFSARLTKSQVEALATTDWFVHAYPDRIYHLQTTHTPRYLGLERDRGLWNATNMGEGIIIGVLDTGIFPGHPSFRDDGMPPPPPKWKGRCEFNESSACNNKLIGARNLCGSRSKLSSSVGRPPVDTMGHGTHTSSTAAGNFVGNASALGSAAGVMAGIAPRAHIALYKVCSLYGCSGEDILAGLDAAIKDGVDVLSLSIGIQDTISFDEDAVSSGAFGAIAKGIFVSAAAGNYGPDPSSTVNEAPWITTVAASSTDRTLKTTVKLGNGLELDGESLYQPNNYVPTQLPLVDPSAISANWMAQYCDEGTLDDVDVRGKIVLCRNMNVERATMADAVKKAGGAGLIILNAEVDGYTTSTDQAALPASNVPYQHALKIKAYVNSTTNPTAAILFKGTVLGSTPSSPAVASFSSRGPNRASPGILKPDIAAPGVNILAAWPFPIGPPGAQAADGSFFFTESGTSMATPHVGGVAALIKKAHPDWSPAAIKSAIMTTADALDRSGKPIADERQLPAKLFALGAGHVNPSKAVDPGLVYDISPMEYISYLCGLGYSDSQVGNIADPTPVTCANVRNITEAQLNYPSITVVLAPDETVVISRTVTNVGEAPTTSEYKVVVDVPEGVSVSAQPKKLRFSAAGEKKTYRIVFKRNGGGGASTAEGQLRLVSTRNTVRSPISIIFK